MPAGDVPLYTAPVTMVRREPGTTASAWGREGGGMLNQCLTLTSNYLLVGAISPFQISPGHGILAPFREQRLISLSELGRGDGFPIPPPHEAQRSAVLISALPRSFAACSLGLLFSVPLIVSFLFLSPSFSWCCGFAWSVPPLVGPCFQPNSFCYFSFLNPVQPQISHFSLWLVGS